MCEVPIIEEKQRRIEGQKSEMTDSDAGPIKSLGNYD
jgi:hypothetical protein